MRVAWAAVPAHNTFTHEAHADISIAIKSLASRLRCGDVRRLRVLRLRGSMRPRTSRSSNGVQCLLAGVRAV
jgi:hypothetical protein